MNYKKPNFSGIYCIYNNITKNFYIGKSQNITTRWNIHLEMLIKNTHHSKKLQQEFNKYDIDNFRFLILKL